MARSDPGNPDTPPQDAPSRRDDAGRIATIRDFVLDLVLDYLPHAVAFYDDEDRLQVANRRYAELLGAPDPAAILGRHVSNVLSADRMAFFTPIIARVKAGEIVTLEHPAGRDPNRMVRTTLWPHRDAEGRWLGIFAKLTDITMIVRANEALRASEARLRALIDLTPMLIVVKDGAGRYLMTNRANAGLYGLPPEAMVGRTLPELGMRPQDAAAVACADAEVREHGRPVTLPDFEMLDSAGRRRVFYRVSLPFRYSDEHPDAILAAMTEITALKEAEEEVRRVNAELEVRVARRTAELAEARDAAESASRAKSAFLANMSHEIRTPMNAVLGMAQLALQARPDPAMRNYLSRIDGAARSLLRVINDVLDFSKIEAGHLEVRDEEFELDAVLSDVLSLTGPQATEKGLRVQLDVAPDVPRVLRGDATRVVQVLANLCANAVKFTDAGSIEVAVCVEAQDAGSVSLAFAVTDTGCGIAPRDLDRLFRPFSQIDESDTRRHGGTGLGLSIAHHLVVLMGGSIGVQSEPGAGSTFRFTIACRRPREMAPQAEIPASLSGQRVLVVDDEVEFRLLADTRLRTLGMQPVSVAGPGEALAALEEAASSGARFDCALVDWRIGEADGLVLVDTLRGHSAAGPSCRIVLVSAYPEAGPALRESPARVDAYLSKPFTREQLAHALVIDTPPAPMATVDLAHGIRILLAEDDELNREVALGMLAATGAVVTIALDGSQAVALARSQAFDLVLMDVQMPVMDGIAATRAIRAIPALAGLPIVAMTASAMVGDRERLIAAGMNDYLAKPVRVAELVSKVRRWARKPAQDSAQV